MEGNLVEAIATGVLIFVLGWYLLKLILEPVAVLRRPIGRMVNLVLMQEGVLTTPDRYSEEERREISAQLQELTRLLFEGMLSIFFHRLTGRLLGLPSRDKAWSAADRLASVREGMERRTDRTPQKNRLLIIETLELLRVSVPERLRADKGKLKEDVAAGQAV